VTEQEPKPGEDCWACGYYRDRLDADSGASDLERDAVLRERHRHRQMYHQTQDFGYTRL
jgi:hypothetical protein